MASRPFLVGKVEKKKNTSYVLKYNDEKHIINTI